MSKSVVVVSKVVQLIANLIFYYYTKLTDTKYYVKQ